MSQVEGVHLRRVEGNAAAIDALASKLGGRVGLEAVLGDLDRRGRRSIAPGLKARWAFTWDRDDRRTRRWWPQGISTSADASDGDEWLGRRLVMTTWYAKPRPDGHHGARVSVIDLASLRYAHVLLVEPHLADDGTVSVAPVKVHAGGLVWRGHHLHVAATARGLVTFHLDDVLRVPDDAGLETFGYRHVLPIRSVYEAVTDDGHERLRYSFISLDRSGSTPQLLAGEYARGRQSRRFVRFETGEDGLLRAGDDGVARPLLLDESGLAQAQGAVTARGRLFVTTSHGPWTPGSLHAGAPGAWTRHRWATPMGPEDLSYWPSRDELWSLSEHPHRRWVFAMPLTAMD
jgi:hypothetical protein